MKLIRYQYLSCEINHGTEENPSIEQVVIGKIFECPTQADYDAKHPIAEKEAIPGTIKVSGEFEEQDDATTDDVLNALLGVTE